MCAQKRGASGLCLVVGVDKPTGMSSHDVVNRCRRIFGERRVGHTGTLDPLASGVLPICIGPATRLDAYMTAHDKRYVVDVVFGTATDTDDCDGEPIRTADVPDQLYSFDFASGFVAGLVGPHKQLPPVYSAIKVGGVKACDAARKGVVIELEPREVEVYSADLIEVFEQEQTGAAVWRIAFSVSKGTYIRSLARDIGNSLGCPAHVGALRRLEAGPIGIADCVSLETLEELGVKAALDPVRLLGYRLCFIDERQNKAVSNGNFLKPEDVSICEYRYPRSEYDLCACTSGVRTSEKPLLDGEIICLVAENRLAALYEFDANRHLLKPRCNFQTGVIRGGNL